MSGDELGPITGIQSGLHVWHYLVWRLPQWTSKETWGMISWVLTGQMKCSETSPCPPKYLRSFFSSLRDFIKLVKSSESVVDFQGNMRDLWGMILDRTNEELRTFPSQILTEVFFSSLRDFIRVELTLRRSSHGHASASVDHLQYAPIWSKVHRGNH